MKQTSGHPSYPHPSILRVRGHPVYSPRICRPWRCARWRPALPAWPSRLALRPRCATRAPDSYSGHTRGRKTPPATYPRSLEPSPRSYCLSASQPCQPVTRKSHTNRILLQKLLRRLGCVKIEKERSRLLQNPNEVFHISICSNGLIIFIRQELFFYPIVACEMPIQGFITQVW